MPAKTDTAPTLSTPVTVVFTGTAGQELRRIARRVGGVGSDAGIVRLAHAAVVRGLAVIEADLDQTLQAGEIEKERRLYSEQEARARHMVATRLARRASDDTDDDDTAAIIERQIG